MKVYAITYDQKNGFELITDEVSQIYSNSFHTIQGDVFEIRMINRRIHFDLYSVECFMFCYLDEKLTKKAFNAFKKKLLQSIDVEINNLNKLKKNIKSQTLKKQ